jgi:hypothetical protein
MIVKLKAKPVNIVIMQVYAPNEDAEKKEKECFYENHNHHHHPFNVLSGIVHVSVGKDVPNYFSRNEKFASQC